MHACVYRYKNAIECLSDKRKRFCSMINFIKTMRKIEVKLKSIDHKANIQKS